MAQKDNNSKEFIWGRKRNKKVWIIVSVVAVVIIAGVLGYIVFGFEADTVLTNSADKDGGPKSTALVRRAIDGVYVPKAQSNHYPVAVMIENLVVSRPQSSLSQANLVYEALVEGGITRFLAIYAGELVELQSVGPIRSARPYYLDWVSEFDAMYMHAGGSSEAMSKIQSYGIFDLDQFYNSQYYKRDTSRPVATEHTLYSSGEQIAFALRDKETEAEGSFDTWKFKDDLEGVARPTEDKSIIIDFSSFNYKVEYKYDANENNYLRYMAGEVHQDANGQDIRAKNVVVQKVATRLIDQERLGMDTVGEGEAIVFLDGKGITGTWKKDSREERTIFYDNNGDEIEFNAGTIWIEVVPTDRDIVYN